MSDSTSAKKKCLSCKKDKPLSDFGTEYTDRVLCKSCRVARVVPTGRKKPHSGGWLDDIGEAIGDFLGSIFD